MARVRSGRKGFTLAEMTVVAVILALLAGAALPLTKTVVKREKELELHRALRTMREAIDAYKKLADEKKIEIEESSDGYPPTLDVLVKGVKVKNETKPGQGGKTGERLHKFLRRIPRDPMTGSADWGLLSSQDKPDSNSWDEKNVYDVYSKSRGTAIDKTKYRDW